jgi:multidrug efflux pump subunit AcrA (membrane-fusion protein)
LAALTAQRWDILVKKQVVSQQAADNATSDATAKKAVADAAQANVRQLEAMETFKTIVAPFDGVVTKRNTDIGALINAGSGAGQELLPACLHLDRPQRAGDYHRASRRDGHRRPHQPADGHRRRTRS